MFKNWNPKTIIPWVIALSFIIGAAWATQTNYLGTVFIADNDTPANQLSITSSGAIETTSFSTTVKSTITRPANTTAYTANTAWANATSSATYTTFSAVCDRNGQNVLIPQIDIYVDENPATKLQGILWLFDTIPTDPLEDNATFVLAAADWATATGNVQGFPFTIVNNGASGATFSGISLTGTTYHARCATGATAIYGMVQVVNTYTPTSGEVMTITLKTIGAN